MNNLMRHPGIEGKSEPATENPPDVTTENPAPVGEGNFDPWRTLYTATGAHQAWLTFFTHNSVTDTLL